MLACIIEYFPHVKDEETEAQRTQVISPRLWFFGQEAYGIQAPQPGIEPAPPHWKAKS